MKYLTETKVCEPDGHVLGSISADEDGSFIMVNKDGSAKTGCLSGGLCQKDRL